MLSALGFTVTSSVADGHKYTVDSSNYTTYTDMLSPGQLTMFSAYPDTYKIHVYEMELSDTTFKLISLKLMVQ